MDDEYDPHVEDDTINEPNFIWNKTSTPAGASAISRHLRTTRSSATGRPFATTSTGTKMGSSSNVIPAKARTVYTSLTADAR